MSDWFTVESVDDATFAISEYGHSEETHAYLLCGSERAVLIDTGLGVANIRAVTDGLTALPILAVATHAHWDHIGGYGYYEDIAIHEAERDWLSVRFPLPPEAVRANLLRGARSLPPDFDPESYRVFQGAPRRILRDGDRLELGGRSLTVIHTPGHSPGHCCFYEPERGVLYTGDLIYAGCLDAFYPSTDPQAFLRSVRRVRALEAGRILPAHHRIDIPVGMIGAVEAGLGELERQGKLRHGSGIFDFGAFQIHL